MANSSPSQRFELFDVVRVIADPLDSHDSPIAVGTTGTIMDVLEDGQSYLVELLGDWDGTEDAATFVLLAAVDVPDIFRETLGIEIFSADQLELVKSADETVGPHSLQSPER